MHLPRRAPLAAAAAAAILLVGVAGAASAHVTVNSVGATQGGYAELTFRVPTESDNTSTVKLQVFFPQDQPLASVSVKPHPGWSFKVSDAKLKTPIKSDDGAVTEAVSKITWTANSAKTAIKPGEFDEFDASAGPLPDADSMVFKALQTYSDGSVVRWIDPSVEGQAEPEHPAPVLTLLPASGAEDATTGTAAPATTSSSSGTAKTALGLSIAALLVAFGAAGVSVLNRRRT